MHIDHEHKRSWVVASHPPPPSAALVADLCTSTRTDEFVACSYNILAESLGSNTIPWVMVVEPQLKKVHRREQARYVTMGLMRAGVSLLTGPPSFIYISDNM